MATDDAIGKTEILTETKIWVTIKSFQGKVLLVVDNEPYVLTPLDAETLATALKSEAATASGK